jgi:hypothetical protein
LKAFHLIFGIVVVIIFVLTGQYMDRYLDHLAHTPDFQRMLYRSRHIYILLSGLLNISIGAYFTYHQETWRKALQFVGSALIASASVLFVLAFIYEPPKASLETPFSGKAMYLILDGTLLHLISGLRRRKREQL